MSYLLLARDTARSVFAEVARLHSSDVVSVARVEHVQQSESLEHEAVEALGEPIAFVELLTLYTLSCGVECLL